MENPIGDGIDDAYAMMLMAEVTDASESETQASSTSSIAKFITATVNDDSGSTTYKPFSDFAGMFSSAVELGSIALSARAPDDATTPASDTTPYTSTYVESSQPTSIPLSDENLTPDKLETDDNTGAGNTPSMTVANAVTAVFLFVLASSIALAFATRWAPRILGFKLPAIRKSKNLASAADQVPSSQSADAFDPEKLDKNSYYEDAGSNPGQSLVYGDAYADTKVDRDAWLEKWHRGKTALLATLQRGRQTEK